MIDFDIVYQHTDFIVVNKPNDVSFHNDKGINGYFNRLSSYLEKPLWPVHRLDKVTSGLLVAAINQSAARQLGKLFSERKIAKTYLALSQHKPNKKQGKIVGDMKKSRSGNWILQRTKTNPAITKFTSTSLMPGTRLFILEPHGGKTHQLRVALKSLGSPILGDTRYGGKESDRAYLHAYRLQFEWNKTNIDIKAKPTNGKYFSSDLLDGKI